MISLEAALERMSAVVASLPAEAVSLNLAAGRWLSEDAFSGIDLPPFDNSAMDGYAVAAAELAAAASDHPANLQCAGETAAGQPPGPPLQPGQCRRIFTGAPLPPGADAVVMQEDTRPGMGDPNQVEFLDVPKPWEHVRFRGEDIKIGAPLAQCGQRLDFGNLAVLAAVGRAQVMVGRRPVVGLIATGDELLEPGATLKAGGLFESNRLMLTTLIAETGCLPRPYPIVRDTLSATEAALAAAAAECDVVITTGGVSVGAYDHVKEAVVRLGGEVDFWQVAIRPGKPFVWGRVKERHFVGLPGNPISCLVTFLLLVRPLLIRLQGGTAVSLNSQQGRLIAAVRNPGPRRHFMRACLDSAGEVRIVGPQGSHVLSGLLASNSLLDLPAGAEWEAGREVQVLRFP